METLSAVKEVLQTILVAASIVGGIFAVITYWRNIRLRRAEWLFNLYQKFFEEPNYKKMRSILDYRKEPEFSKLRSALARDSRHQLVEDLVDYLNFFEFVAGLWQLGQITLLELRMVFDYYLNNLASIDFVQEFVKTQGFESLANLLRETAVTPPSDTAVKQ